MPKPEYPRYIAQTELLSPAPVVSLLARTTSTIPEGVLTPEQLTQINSAAVMAGEAGRTCYSPKLITPLDYVFGTAKHREITDMVVASTREAGHFTTRQHINYVFGMEGISRLAIWEVFHSFPYYNTDQQSQRYVEMSESGLIFPKEEPVIREGSLRLIAGYNKLVEVLSPIAMEQYKLRFPGRNNSKKWENKNSIEAQKKAQEVARYLLPLSMTANFFYSINELTLLRLYKQKNTYRTSPESAAVIDMMVRAVSDVDPSFAEELDEPVTSRVARELPRDNYLAADEFDRKLDGKPARVRGAETMLSDIADAVRTILGYSSDQMSDKEAVDMALDPAQNKLLASVGGEMVMDQISQALNAAVLKVDVSLSLSADAQLQRHRGLDHLVPELYVPRLNEDIVVPALLDYSAEAKDIYLQYQAENIEALRSVGSDNFRYLLTNGTKIRKTVTGPLGPFYHFLKSRTCLNAQEEAYYIAVSMAEQLGSDYFDQPTPCGVRMRAGITPYCPEGDRTCGVPMFRRRISEGYPKRSI